MKKFSLALLAIATALAISTVASAQPNYDFTYTSNDNSVVASGVLYAVATATPGVLLATSGNIIVTDTYNSLTSTGTLISNPNAPGTSCSPTGYFFYDDLLMPSQNPLITNAGLLFSNSIEINLFSNGPGPGTYQIYGNNGANDKGNFALTQVPDGGTTLALLGLAIAGLAGLRRKLGV